MEVKPKSLRMQLLVLCAIMILGIGMSNTKKSEFYNTEKDQFINISVDNQGEELEIIALVDTLPKQKKKVKTKIIHKVDKDDDESKDMELEMEDGQVIKLIINILKYSLFVIYVLSVLIPIINL